MLRRITVTLLVSLLFLASVAGQERKVQNRPYTDLRWFHFGIQIGTHLQDIEFMNVGPVTVIDDDEGVSETFISCDQDKLDPGFNVGVIGEFRLSELFQFRIAPAIYFGSRHITFRNHTESSGDDVVEQRQTLKSAYFLSAFDIIFAAPRCNNHRVYLMAGLTPSINLTSKATDYLKLKKTQIFMEVGLGVDRYLQYFKCRPELKFMFGLGNALDTDHVDELKDSNMKIYTQSVSEARTKMITLTLYFE